MIRLLLCSFVLIQSSPQRILGDHMCMCACVHPFHTCQCLTLCLSLFFFLCQSPFLLSFPASYLPPTNTCKTHVYLHAATTYSNTHTHTQHLQFIVLSMVDGRGGSACGGCQISRCRGGILVNERQKYSSYSVSVYV